MKKLFTFMKKAVCPGPARLAVEGKPDSEVLWDVVEVTQVYLYGHLGISSLLSAFLATPGCEMRAGLR